MREKAFANGDVRVRFPESVDVVGHTRARSTDGDSALGYSDVLDLVTDSGFDVIAELDVVPTRQLGGADVRSPVAIEVEASPDEETVVLVERAGLWSWRLPQSSPATRGTTSTRVHFEIDTIGESAAERGVFGAIVLRFATALTIKALESQVRPGLVHIRGVSLGSWKWVASLEDVGLPQGRAPRILLLVHGTFSNTPGAYAMLTTEPGLSFLTRALGEYDAVIGFDHPTLSVDPVTNARDLLERLAVRGSHGPQLDIISHSRGGLVARSLVEHVIPGSGWTGAVENIVFVGVPNAGTHFVDRGRWVTFVDLYTNLLLATASDVIDGDVAKAVAAGTIKGVGMLVKYLATHAARGGVPGLAAMEPGGAFLRELNGTQPGQPAPGTPWFAIESDFHVTRDDLPAGLPTAFALWLAERTVDDVLDDANDLVVDTQSMSAIDTPPGGYLQDVLPFGPNSVVHHLNYFVQREVADALSFWLIAKGDRLIAAETPPSVDDVAQIEIPAGPWVGDSGGPYAAEAGRWDRGLHDLVLDDGEIVRDEPDAVQAHLAGEMPRELPVAKPAEVRVMLSRNVIELDPTMAADFGVLNATEGEVFTVQVIPKRNVTVVGNDIDKLALPAGGGTSAVPFTVEASAPGPVEVKLVVRRSQTDIAAALTLRGEAVAGEMADGQEVTRDQIVAAAKTSVVLDDAVWLEISELELPDGGVRFQYDLRLPDEATVFRYLSAPLRDRAGYVAKLFNGIERRWSDCGGNHIKFTEYLQDRGSALFEELFPQELQSRLWNLRNDLTSIVLLADEPYFPWELVHLKPPVGPRQGKTRFFAQYGLLRWQFLPFPAAPELRVRSGKVLAVCPKYVDPRYVLTESEHEADFLKAKLNAKSVSASERNIRNVLRRGGFDVLHFSGHGAAKTDNVAESVILLQGRKVDGDYTRELLSATAVAENARLRNPDGSGPLVVLNACQAGLGGEQLSSLGGFARAFLKAGAQAVVACLWSVKQGPSRIFVETLYERLLGGDVIRDAVVHARDAARTEGDSATSLAFVVYARPDARLVLE